MSNIVLQTPELNIIEPSKAEKIREVFMPMADMLEQFEKNYNQIVQLSQTEINAELTKKAKRLRLDIAKVRIETEKTRKREKEEYLRAGKAIDGVANILKWAVTDKENKLKEIEDYFIIQERKRLEALQNERAEILSAYVDDAHERDLAHMDNDVWEAYLSAKKKEYKDRIEAEKEAERLRLEEERKRRLRTERMVAAAPFKLFITDFDSIEWENISNQQFERIIERAEQSKQAYLKEQEEVRKENERLRKERELAEKRRIEEEAKRKAEEERKRKMYEEKLRKEREEKRRIKAELLKKQEEERIKAEEEKRRKEEELRMSEKEHFASMVDNLKVIISKYNGKFNSEVYVEEYGRISRFINNL